MERGHKIHTYTNFKQTPDVKAVALKLHRGPLANEGLPNDRMSMTGRNLARISVDPRHTYKTNQDQECNIDCLGTGAAWSCFHMRVPMKLQSAK